MNNRRASSTKIKTHQKNNKTGPSNSVSGDIILFNKPCHVISQFSPSGNKITLANFINEKSFYPAGRLDYDSEGLLLLTNNGKLQAKIADPKHHLEKTYWAQVEGQITDTALRALHQGIHLKDGKTRPAKAHHMHTPGILWPRTPPIRERKNIPTSWIELKISEGRNRQVRRMTAAVGFPTLRLIRYAIGAWNIERISLGEQKKISVTL